MNIRYKVLSVFFALLLLSCEQEPNADLVIHNGNIYTVDDSQPKAGRPLAENLWVEAVAVKDGKIIARGTADDMLKLTGSKTKEIDAKGNFVMPGFIEGHGHYSGLGRSLMNLNFMHSKNWDEIVAMVKEKVEQTEAGEWIIGRGWHQEKWSAQPDDHVHGYPNNYELTAISPNNPVMLTHASGHGLFANERAMQMAGITAETPDPAGGEIVRNKQGKAIGMFEERAQNLIRDAYNVYLQSLSAEERHEEWLQGIRLAEEECLRKGVTSFQDAGSRFHEIEEYTALAENGDMNLRLWAMIRQGSDELKEKAQNYRIIGAGDDFFTCRSIKVSIDGALGSFGAWLLEPYEDKEGFYGQNTTTIEEVDALAEIALESKMQLCVHAIGDRANRETLDIFESRFSHAENGDLRWRIEHSQHIHPQDIVRFAELGVIASMQGIHCTSDAPFVVKRLGEKRAREGAYNWRALIDAGALVTNGTDVPVEDVDPISSFYASVTRKRIDNGMEFFTENVMTRKEAIFSYTMANALAAFEEDNKGSIEVGKYADFVILSEDLINCSDEEILKTKVLTTIVGGEVKYEDESFNI